MSNKIPIKFIRLGLTILLIVAVVCWQTIYVNEKHESHFKVQALEKLVSASVNPANLNKSQNLEKVTPLKTQDLTLTQALELAKRNNQGLSPEMRLTVFLKYYDAQQADAEVSTAQAAVMSAQAILRDALALERAGVGTRFNVLIAQVNLADTKQALTHALGLQRIERSKLAFQLGVPLAMSVSPTDPVQLAASWNQTLEESIALTSQNKQQLQRTQKSLQIEVAYTCLQSALENVQITNMAYEETKEVLRLARLHFQAGVGTQTEVIETQTKLTASQAHKVESILDYNRALAYLQRDVSSSEIASSHLQYEQHRKEGSSCSYGK